MRSLSAAWHVPVESRSGPTRGSWHRTTGHFAGLAAHTWNTLLRPLCPLIGCISTSLILIHCSLSSVNARPGHVPLQIVGHARPDIVEVTHDYTAQKDDELTLRVGDTIQGTGGSRVSCGSTSIFSTPNLYWDRIPYLL